METYRHTTISQCYVGIDSMAPWMGEYLKRYNTFIIISLLLIASTGRSQGLLAVATSLLSGELQIFFIPRRRRRSDQLNVMHRSSQQSSKDVKWGIGLG